MATSGENSLCRSLQNLPLRSCLTGDRTGDRRLWCDSLHRPALALLSAEPFRAAMELALHKLGKSDDVKPGDGHPVIIFPGLGANGKSVHTFRVHCRVLGYDAFDCARTQTGLYVTFGQCARAHRTGCHLGLH